MVYPNVKLCKYASQPDWRIFPHADRRSPRNTNSFATLAVTEQAAACFSQHTRSAAVQPSLSHRANNRRTCYRFFNFWPRGLPLGQSSSKGEMTWWTPRSTVLQNFIALCQPTPEISVTTLPKSCGQNDRTTKNKQ